MTPTGLSQEGRLPIRWAKRAKELKIELSRGNLEPADLLDPLVNRDRWRLMRMTDQASMVGRDRRRHLLALMGEIDRRGIDGDVCELGVFKGGTAGVLGRACQRSPRVRHLWLFDSFQGLPEPRPEDGPDAAAWARGRVEGRTVPIGGAVGTRNEVESFLFDTAALDPDRVTLVEGWYQDTLKQPPVRTIALLHLDCDWYESVKIALDALWDRVVPGGCLVLDDYGRWPGARKAFHEAMESRDLNPPLHRAGHTQAYIWKE